MVTLKPHPIASSVLHPAPSTESHVSSEPLPPSSKLEMKVDYNNHPEISLAVNLRNGNGDATRAYTHRTLFEKSAPFVHTVCNAR